MSVQLKVFLLLYTTILIAGAVILLTTFLLLKFTKIKFKAQESSKQEKKIFILCAVVNIVIILLGDHTKYIYANMLITTTLVLAMFVELQLLRKLIRRYRKGVLN